MAKEVRREPVSREYGDMTDAERRRVAAALMSKINQNAGHTVITTADKLPSTFGLRRPTGIMQLDIDTGGGFPAGCQVKISGPEGAGKTMLLYMAYAMHQRIYGDSAFINHFFTESLPDVWFMRKCGVVIPVSDQLIEEKETERVRRGLPKFTKEERAGFKRKVGEFYMSGGMPGEQTLQEILRCARENIFGIIGCDSITRIAPEGELAKDLDDDAKMAAKALMKSKFFDQYHHLVTNMDAANYTTLIMTGQARANMTPAGPYDRKWKPAEDYSGRHGYQISILVNDGQNIYRKHQGKNTIVGKHMNWDVEKGKAGTHDNIRGEIEVIYSKSNDLETRLIDPIQSMLTPGYRYAVLRENRGTVDIFRASGEEMMKGVTSPEDLVTMLRNDQKLELEIRHEILAAAGCPCLYRL